MDQSEKLKIHFALVKTSFRRIHHRKVAQKIYTKYIPHPRSIDLYVKEEFLAKETIQQIIKNTKIFSTLSLNVFSSIAINKMKTINQDLKIVSLQNFKNLKSLDLTFYQFANNSKFFQQLMLKIPQSEINNFSIFISDNSLGQNYDLMNKFCKSIGSLFKSNIQSLDIFLHDCSIGSDQDNITLINHMLKRLKSSKQLKQLTLDLGENQLSQNIFYIDSIQNRLDCLKNVETYFEYEDYQDEGEEQEQENEDNYYDYDNSDNENGYYDFQSGIDSDSDSDQQI